MPFGVIALLAVAVLVYFGVLHRVLDRMRLDDRTALLIIFLMIVGSFFNLTILRQPPLVLNIGGALIPIGIAVYLITTADTRREQLRGSAAALLAGAAIYLSIKFLNPEEQTMVIDPAYFFAIVAGVIGYLAGRSRRSAFVAGTMGVVLADIAHYVEISARNVPARTWIGGAGAFDAVVIAGLLAVALAEIVGETREFMARGPLRGAPDAGGAPRGQARETPRDDRAGDDRAGARTADDESGARDDDVFTAAIGGADRPKAREADAARHETSGGEGWQAPILGDAGPPAAAESDYVTEPDDSLAPGTAGVDLTTLDLGREAGCPVRPLRERRRRNRRRNGGGRRGGGTDA